MATTGDLTRVLHNHLPEWLSMRRSLYLLTTLAVTAPLLHRHNLQRHQPRQPEQTGWLKTIYTIISNAFYPETIPITGGQWDDTEENPSVEEQHQFLASAEHIAALMDWDGVQQDGMLNFSITPCPLLITSRTHCRFCSIDNHPVPLCRENESIVTVIGPDCQQTKGHLIVAYCTRCKANYFPDSITIAAARGERRLQYFERDAQWLRVSKHGVWAHRKVAILQQNVIKELRGTWQRFRLFFNETFGHGSTLLTERQTYRLYTEHFIRILLDAQGSLDDFTCPSFAEPSTIIKAALGQLGVSGGLIPGGKEHECGDCMHEKRYRTPNPDGEDVEDESAFNVADLDDHHGNHAPGGEVLHSVGPPSQICPPGDGPVGFTWAAVMDGKTLVHRICQVDDCHHPLKNYRDGVFCADHDDLSRICGISGCTAPQTPGSKACANITHERWYQAYLRRFGRLSFGSVTRIIRHSLAQQQASATGIGPPGNPTPAGPDPALSLHPALPDGPNGEPGASVTHRFRAGTTYCVQTLQWSCGVPIGWGKCYKSESVLQVLAIINKLFPEDMAGERPSFIFYDNACKLLAHILTQNPNDSWLDSTWFIIDSWHYINHRATDILCRTWCNPAPADGSQPDLVVERTDTNGRTHTTRAYNTETAEQLNAWLNAFEAALRQMTDYNFDFFIFVILFLYKESVEGRIAGRQEDTAEEEEDDWQEEGEGTHV